MSSPWPDQPSENLTDVVVALAGLPDDAPSLRQRLARIVQLAVVLVDPVDYASVTLVTGDGHRTHAASSGLAETVDLAQYVDEAGPCLVALHSGDVVGVPDVARAVVWSGFRDVAWRCGIRASLSVPLFAGSGDPIAALNLYARDATPMRVLIERVRACYQATQPVPGPRMDAGSEQLLAGLAGALRARDVIQQAMGVLMGRNHASADSAYRRLVRATKPGAPLTATAAVVLRQPSR